jgi:hypothetical protein
MKYTDCLVIVAALSATAASAAPVPVIESKGTLTAAVVQADLAKRELICNDPPECNSFSHYPDPEKRGLATETMENGISVSIQPRNHLLRRAYFTKGSPECIGDHSGCYTD